MMAFIARTGWLVVGLAATLAGCTNNPSEFMREPSLSPIGQVARPIANLYTDQTVSRVGDIVTVIISINDKAQFDNTTDRSKTAASKFDTNWGYTQGGGSSAGGSTPSSVSLGATSTSSTQGQGNIDRQEQIQVSVAAVVTEVLPNGNLVISGSQEVRVNYELRQLTVAGIVRPTDISRRNTVSYDQVAEARISYGGRGRLSEVQQPSWGQELWDSLKPY